MKRYGWLLLIVTPALTLPAQANPFSKKPAVKTNPMIRVPELLFQLKMDASEKKRLAAAEELREYDSQKNPEIVPGLTDALQTDKAAAVRTAAAQSLGRIRPITTMASQALEHASQKDSVFRVRMQAWTSLRMNQFSGNRAPNPKDPKNATNGPMMANPGMTPMTANPSMTPLMNPGTTPMMTSPGMTPMTAGPGETIIYVDPKNPGVPIAAPNQPMMMATPSIQPLTVPASSGKYTAPAKGPISPTANRSEFARPLPSSPPGGFSTAMPMQPQRIAPPPLVLDDGPPLAPPPRQ